MARQTEIPWHHNAWQQIKQARAGGRLPHALLICGPSGVGKATFVDQLHRLLLCEQPDWEAAQYCGLCQACTKTAHGAHPDFQRFEPREDKREILIEDIRNLLRFIQISPQVSHGYKLAVVAPADVMTRSAANALLKTLEEPPENRILLLVTDTPGRIPATIRSRCQLLRIPQPPRAQALEWLAQVTDKRFDESFLDRHDNAVLDALQAWRESLEEGAGEAPENLWQKQWLSVVQGRHSALAVAEQWASEDEQKTLIHWLLRENIAATRRILGAETAQTGDIFATTSLGLKSVLIIQNKLNELARISDTTINSRLLWETFLLDCHRMAEQTAK